MPPPVLVLLMMLNSCSIDGTGLLIGLSGCCGMFKAPLSFLGERCFETGLPLVLC